MRGRWWTGLAGALVVTVAGASTPPQQDEPVPYRLAITLDDVPGHHWAGHTPSEGTARILAALGRHEVRATGFVNCEKEGQELLPAWLSAGQDLGNHHATHADLNKTSPAVWLKGVERCTGALTRVLGRRPHTFRYPYLHNGPTPQIRDDVAETLRASGLEIARVTVDNHEWKLAELYHDARLAKDEARGRELAAEYVVHVRAATQHARAAARERLGHDISHVLLLHVNGLEADHLDALLAALRADGARFISLEEALRDPVYALPNSYAGRAGVSWLDRIPGAPPDDFLDREWERLFGGN